MYTYFPIWKLDSKVCLSLWLELDQTTPSFLLPQAASNMAVSNRSIEEELNRTRPKFPDENQKGLVGSTLSILLMHQDSGSKQVLMVIDIDRRQNKFLSLACQSSASYGAARTQPPRLVSMRCWIQSSGNRHGEVGSRGRMTTWKQIIQNSVGMARLKKTSDSAIISQFIRQQETKS